MNKDAVVCESYFPHIKKPKLVKETANKVLQKTTEVLEKLKVDYWISAGTLLGIYRDGDFIDGDTDIDVEMTGNYEPVLVEIDKLAPRYRDMWHKASGTRLQAMWLFEDNTRFDIYMFYKVPRGLKSYVHLSDQYIIYPPDLKRSKIEFKGKVYPCWEPERYLNYVYGPTWRVKSNIRSVYGKCQ